MFTELVCVFNDKKILANFIVKIFTLLYNIVRFYFNHILYGITHFLNIFITAIHWLVLNFVSIFQFQFIEFYKFEYSIKARKENS